MMRCCRTTAGRPAHHGGVSNSFRLLSHVLHTTIADSSDLHCGPKSNPQPYGLDAGSIVQNALTSFDRMILIIPKPRISIFFPLLNDLVRVNEYPTVISLIKRLESSKIWPDVYVYTLMINCFCRLKLTGFAFSVLANIFKLGHQPDAPLFSSLIYALYNSGKILEAAVFLHKVVRNGYPAIGVLYCRIINGLCKIGENDSALWLLEMMDTGGCIPDIYAYNPIIDSLCKDGKVNEASYLFLKMKGKGITPDVITYSSLFHGICKLGNLEEAKRLLDEMNYNNIPYNMHTISMLVDSLCKRGMLTDAEQVVKVTIERGQEPDIVIYNSLILGYCIIGQMDKAMYVFDSILRGYPNSEIIESGLTLFGKESLKLTPSIFTFNILIKGLCEANRPRDALALFYKMQNHGCAPNTLTYTPLLDSLFRNNYLKEAMTLFRVIEASALQPNIYVYTTIIDGFCKAGRLESAKETFSSLDSKNVQPNQFTSNALINGFCKQGLLNEANDLVGIFAELGCPPDACTYNIILQGYLEHDDTSRAEQHIHMMVENGFIVDAVTITMLLDLLSLGRFHMLFLNTVL